MRLATWNVNSLKVRLPHVLDWLAENPVDVLCLQETKQQDSDFPQDELQAAGYQSVFSGQKTYNGVAILSRTASRISATTRSASSPPLTAISGWLTFTFRTARASIRTSTSTN